MAYEIHIKRVTGKIAFSEWKSAVQQAEGIRFLAIDQIANNLTTSDVISISPNDGDAELFISSNGRWFAAFHWRPRSGDVTIKATPEFGDRSSPLRIAARQLASLLEAQLIGDEGEVYE